MRYSYFQDVNSRLIKNMFSYYLNRELHEEVPVGINKRIDLASLDGEYGFEFKSGHYDLNTGCGLNQNNFKYGYLVVPDKYKFYAIGKLYCNEQWDSGLISVLEDGKHISLIKPSSCGENDFERLFS